MMVVARAAAAVLMLGVCVNAYSSGAPEFPQVCNDMMPGGPHGAAQTSAAPYAVTFSPSTFTPGGAPITVTASATSGTPFKGFLLSRHSDTDTAAKPGTFSSVPSNAKIICSGDDVTHTSSAAKTSLQFQWTPPATSEGHIQFKATFVQSLSPSMFWKAVPASSLLLDSTLGAPTTADPNAPTQPTTPTTTTPTTPAPTGALAKDPACGITKGCYSKCSSDADCQFMFTWAAATGDFINVTLSGNVGGDQNAYIALGLSRDSKMGRDSIMYCVKDNAGQSFNPGGYSPPQTLMNDPLMSKSFSLIDGVLSCNFLRNKSAAKFESGLERFGLESQGYNLLFASGPGFSTGIGKHSSLPLVSTQAAKLTDFTVDISGETKHSVLVMAHGSLMIVAWIFAASIGMVMARYYKTVWAASTLAGEKVWFQLHRACMVIALLATVSAFIIIFVEVGGYSEIQGEGYKKAHPVLGIIVTILTIINPTMALLRPHPGTKNRPIFNWAHYGVGNAAYTCGVISVFFGVKMDKADAPDYLIYVLAAFVAWFVVITLLLEVAQCREKSTAKSSQYEMSDVNKGEAANNPKRSEAMFHKKMLIMLHVMVVSGFTIALIVILNTSHDH